MALGPGMEDQPGMEEGVEVGIAMLTVMPMTHCGILCFPFSQFCTLQSWRA